VFLKSSRYAGVATVTALDRSGREVTGVRLRRIPETDGEATAVSSSDRLDVMADARYQDATRYWHIGDANSELEVGELVDKAGRTIRVPAE
jgi:hypothetical protein